jgi:hypothetical protein
MRSDLYFGRRQYGKSTLAMSNALETKRAVFVWDPACCFAHWPESTAQNLSRLSELLNADPEYRARIIVYQPGTEEVPEEFEAVFSLLERKAGYVLIVDECHWIQNPSWATPSLRRLIRKPNQFDAIVMQTCHAPADTWARTRSLATDWFMFKLTRAADLEAIERECGSEVAEAVSELPAVHSPSLPGERRVYIHYQVDSAEWEAHDEQEKWYVDLSALPVVDSGITELEEASNVL